MAAGGVAESLEQPGLFIVYAAYLPDRDAASVQAVLSDEIARVRDKPIRRPTSWTRRRTSWRPRSCSGSQTVDGIAQALGRAQYVEGDWQRFVDGATRYAGRHRRRRAAGGAQVPGRRQPHTRDAGPADPAARRSGRQALKPRSR